MREATHGVGGENGANIRTRAGAAFPPNNRLEPIIQNRTRDKLKLMSPSPEVDGGFVDLRKRNRGEGFISIQRGERRRLYVCRVLRSDSFSK